MTKRSCEKSATEPWPVACSPCRARVENPLQFTSWFIYTDTARYSTHKFGMKFGRRDAGTIGHISSPHEIKGRGNAPIELVRKFPFCSQNVEKGSVEMLFTTSVVLRKGQFFCERVS